MAYEESLHNRTLEAEDGDAIAGYQYRYVRLAGEHMCGVTAADPVVGVMQNHATRDNEAVTVAIGGTTMVVAGETLAAGQFVTAGADGRAVAAADNAAGHGIVIRGAPADQWAAVSLRNLM